MASGRHHATATGASLRCACHAEKRVWIILETCPDYKNDTVCYVQVENRLPNCCASMAGFESPGFQWKLSLLKARRLQWREVRCAKTLSCAFFRMNFCRVEDWTHSMELRSQTQFGGMFPSNRVLLPGNTVLVTSHHYSLTIIW